MRVYIYCSTKKSFERIRKALLRQEIAFRSEKQTIPLSIWAIESHGKPTVKDWSDTRVEVDNSIKSDDVYIV